MFLLSSDCDYKTANAFSVYNYGERSNDSPLVIYLPGTSSDEVARSSYDDPRCLDLGISESLTRKFRVARINYRWGQNFEFPTPTHDVTIAYDTIVKKLCTPKTRIGVYGRYIGGTLATSLALTENKKRSSSSIAVLATSNAIYNWTNIPAAEVVLDNNSHLTGIKDERNRALAAEERRDAVIMRKRLFHSPSECFDVFASPILFFRNAGVEVPDEFTDDFMPTKTDSPSSEQTAPSPEAMGKRPNAMPRKSHIRFPPKYSNLVIPKTRITTTVGAWREQQGRELAKLMKRSIVMHEMKENRDSDVNAEDEAESRIQFVANAIPNVGGVLADEDSTVAWLEDALENC